MTVLDATKNSVNLAYLTMAMQLDLCSIMDGAAQIGIHKAGGNAGEGNADAYPANVIGSNSIAPLSMAAAFAAFAANGTYCKPIAITSVVDADGVELPVPSADCSPVIDPKYTSALTFALRNVWQGTADKRHAAAVPDRRQDRAPPARTSTPGSSGYSPLRAAAVWVGFSDGMRPVQDMTINGKLVRNAYGATIAGPDVEPVHDADARRRAQPRLPGTRGQGGVRREGGRAVRRRRSARRTRATGSPLPGSGRRSLPRRCPPRSRPGRSRRRARPAPRCAARTCS